MKINASDISIDPQKNNTNLLSGLVQTIKFDTDQNAGTALVKIRNIGLGVSAQNIFILLDLLFFLTLFDIFDMAKHIFLHF